MGVKVADKFVAMGDFELLDAQDVLVDIGGTPKRLQEAIDNGELGDKYSSNAPIGVIQAFSGQTAPHGYLICDGASYKVADYPDLYAVIGNTYGGDSTNFNVPNLIDKFIQGSTTSGTEMDAGLPNITGSFIPGSVPESHANYAKGAFYGRPDTGKMTSNTVTPIDPDYGYGFDASKSNPIYGNSDTVQPPALTMVYIIKAFHTNEGVDSGVSDDVINYVNDSLVDKADKSYVDDNFATMDKVAEDTKTANGGKVIKFPNGTMIQSGVKTSQSDSYVPFDVTFVNKNYTLIISPSSDSRDISVGNKFEAGFGIVNGSNVTVNYIAIGSWK